MPGFTLGTVASSHNINAIWGWGSNASYRLGTGSTTNQTSPVQTNTFTDWEQIGLGGSHGIAIRNGKLYSWGSNANGLTGQGTTTGTTNTPTQVGTDSDWAKVHGGTVSAAIKKDGTLWTWGAATNGLLGNGTTTGTVTTPTQIGSDTDWTSICSGLTHMVAIKGGKLFAWGSNANFRTALGTSSGTTTTPTQVGSATDWVVATALFEATAVINSGGELYTVGSNNLFQTGLNTNSGSTSSLTRIGTATDWEDVQPSTGGGVLAKKAGKLWAWGRNFNGQLGDGTTNAVTTPKEINSSTGWVLPRNFGNGSATGVSMGLRNGALFTWGAAVNGALGNGTTTPDVLTPTQIGTATDWKIVSGHVGTIAIRG